MCPETVPFESCHRVALYSTNLTNQELWFPAWVRVSIAHKRHFVQDLKGRSEAAAFFFHDLKFGASGWAPGIVATHIYCWGSAGSPR